MSNPLISTKEVRYLAILQTSAHKSIEAREFESLDRGAPAEGKDIRRKGHFAQLAYTDGSESVRRSDWRKQDMRRELGVDSLKKVRRNQLRTYKAHLKALAEIKGALQDAINTGLAPGALNSADTIEARERWVWKINKALEAHQQVADNPATAKQEAKAESIRDKGGPLGLSYVFGLIKRNEKQEVTDLMKLDAWSLRKTYFTLENAIAYREGKSKK